MNDVAAKSRPGAYARGEDTRRRLIEAAIEAFGTHGFDGTTTRMLAEQAAVTLPSIQYYFGSKEGLYRAVVEHIVTNMTERLGPAAGRARAAVANPKLPRADILARLCDLLEELLLAITRSDESLKRFLSRAEVEGADSLTLLQDGMRRHMIDPCAALVARLTGGAADDEDVLLRTLAVIGQVSAFCHVRARHAMGLVELTDRQVETVRRLVREQTKAIFGAVARESKQ